MDAGLATAEDHMEVSVTGSTGGGQACSTRTGKGAKSSNTRVVASKFMQAGNPPPTGHRPDVSCRDAYQLRAGASMGYASTAATPANAMRGRSLHLTSALKDTGIITTRTIAHHQFGASPGAGATTLTAASMAPPMQLSNAMDAAAQERRREQLAKFKLEKAARRAGASAATSSAATAAGGTGAAGAPRVVPPLALGILREGAQAAGDGSRSARGVGGVYSSGAGGSDAAQMMSARAGQLHSARHQAQGRPAGAAPATAGRAGAVGAAANAAKAPSVPRPAMPPPGVVEQQLRTAVNSPLPKDEVWEAAQVALPADGFEEGASGPGAAKTPSSRITKSPRVVANGGGGSTWAAPGQALPMQPPPPPAFAAVPQQQPSVPVPPRSPPPPSQRAMPVSSHAAPPSVAGSAAGDAYGGRATSNAEASTSDTSNRSVRDQIKMARLMELQFRSLNAKLVLATRARVERGLKQMCAMALELCDMMERYAANNARLAAQQAARRTEHVLDRQLPLLQQWRAYQDAHGPATREVLTALQNALTSLPLVNGASLGPTYDGQQAVMQLRAAVAKASGTLAGMEDAVTMLLHGSNPRGSGGGQVQAGQGGVTAMAALLPQLQAQLMGEVANMRGLLTNLNTMAAKYDEAACLRARAAAAALTAPRLSTPSTGLGGGFWGEGAAEQSAAAAGAARPGGAAGGLPRPGADLSMADMHAALEAGVAMLGLGLGDV